MSEIIQGDLGPVTAYAYAREGGYEGTEAEFEAMMADLLTSKDAAAASAEAAENAADEARRFTGAPRVAPTAEAMTNHDHIYVYTGSEPGYTAGNWYFWNGTAWESGGVYNSTAFTTDKTLTISGDAADAKVTGDAIRELTDQIEDLNYKPISITAFTVSPNQAEIGGTVSTATLNWTLNKKPTTLTLDGAALTPAASGTETKTGLSLTANKTFTLAATDSGSPTHAPASASKNATISFLSKVHYGLASASQTITDAFINGLTGVLAASRQRTVSFSPSGSQYIYFALPTGMCSGINFVVASGAGAGFALAVDLVANSMSHTNASGGVVAYNVYRSSNPISSALSVKIE